MYIVLARACVLVKAAVACFAEAVLGKWKPTGWAASPFREIENAAPKEAGGPSKALQNAAKGTRNISSFFGRPAQAEAKAKV